MEQDRIIILEANTPDMTARGRSGAGGFVRFFKMFAPDTDIVTVNPYETQQLDLEAYRAAVFTGSGVAWSTDDTRAKPQQKAMEAVFAAGLPAWGSCNGLQLAAVVLGGAVGASPQGMEVGLARGIAAKGERHAMHERRNGLWSAPCIHRDEVTQLPMGARVTATNTHSAVQAMVYSEDGIDFWGTQYHPELRAKDIAAYIKDQSGIFSGYLDLAQKLEKADDTEKAAARLGIDAAALAPHWRGLELINWLHHIGISTAQATGPSMNTYGLERVKAAAE